MSAGHLLTYLYSNTSQKVIPNPPGTLQTSIDNEVKNFQRILDGIDMEIQMGQKYLKESITERDRAKSTENSNDNNKPSAGPVDLTSDDGQKASEDVSSSQIKIEDDPDISITNDITNNNTNDNNDNDNTNTNDSKNNDDNSNNNNNDNNNNNNDDENLVNAFDMPDETNQGFMDNDLDALLDSVGGPPQQNNNSNAGASQQQDDGIGGLFGDDFDFIIPDQ